MVLITITGDVAGAGLLELFWQLIQISMRSLTYIVMRLMFEIIHTGATTMVIPSASRSISLSMNCEVKETTHVDVMVIV